MDLDIEIVQLNTQIASVSFNGNPELKAQLLIAKASLLQAEATNQQTALLGKALEDMVNQIAVIDQ